MKLQRLKFSPSSYTELEEKAVLECIKRSSTGTGPKFLNLRGNLGIYN